MNFGRRLLAYLGYLLASFATVPLAEAAVGQDMLISTSDGQIGVNLTLPESCPQRGCAALVLGHGSAPSARTDFGFYRRIGLSLGFAVLTYDKRGVGESTGTFEPFSVENSDHVFRELAGDMVEVTRWLASRPDIDAEKIGMLGGSQAGWIMPLAVDMGAPASFIIIGEGVTVSAGAENIHGMTLMDLRGSEDSEEISAADVFAADEVLRHYAGPKGYDPAPVLARQEVPTLWLFGLRDHVIPVGPSLDILRQKIASGSRNHQVQILPFGDHNFRDATTGERYPLATIINGWLTEIGHAAISADEAEIHGLLDGFMQGIETQSREAILAPFLNGDVIFSSIIPRSSGDFTHVSNAAEFADLILSQERVPSEAFSNVEISVHDTTAMVGFDYSFALDGEVNNYGYECWTLIKTAEGWKAVSVIWSTNLPG